MRQRYIIHMLTLVSGMLIGFYGAVYFGSISATGTVGQHSSLLAHVRDKRDKSASALASSLAVPTPCPPCAACKACRPQPDNAISVDALSNYSASEAGRSVETLKKRMGLEMFGFVDGNQASAEFLDFLPANVKSGVYNQSMVLMTSQSGFKSSHSSSLLSSRRSPGDTLDFSDLQTCKEVDVISMVQGRCYVAINTPLKYSSSHVHRYQHQPRSEEKKSDEGGKQGREAGAEGWSLVPRIANEGSAPPSMRNIRKHEAFLLELFSNLPSLEQEAEAFFSRVADTKKRVMVMALNEGDIDLLVNFVCSAKQAGVSLSNLVVIGADQSVVDVATSLKLHSFSHPAFGTLPSEHSEFYGDAGFQAIMWLKVVSVWIALRLGYHVLFQDADLVWFKSPWSAFDDESIDGFFMDDGARSERFSPLYANSGFYFLRSNRVVSHFMQGLLFSYDSIVQYASHQTVFIQGLTEHIARNGMRVKVLSNVEFPGGQIYHHRKELMKQISARTYLPYVFHMCWTRTKADKLSQFIASDLWYLTTACNGTDATLRSQQEGKISIDTCCLDPTADFGAVTR